ncbi:MAG TPA: amidohydrolase [Candidatus Polarisedimenticolia bacterium]|nr:amidohydrolase [Candidatus Polarisedimenticolia bacterium]
MERLSRRLFDLCELSEQEHASSGLLKAFLRRHGFRVMSGAGGLPTAFVARRRVGRGGPRIGLLAEYDALPDIGHACGHNLIGAAACGAAALSAHLLDGRGAEIIVYGTPAEETIGGKIVLARRGLFRGLDAALMFHPSTEDRVYMTSLACHSFEVEFRGRSAHAVASPEKGINALAALLALFAAMERLRPSLPPETRMPGIIADGGRRPNIVPDRAVGRFTLRAGDLRRLGRVERAFFAAGRAAARNVGARVRFRPVDLPYAEMRTNGPLAEIFKEELRALGRGTVDTPRRGMGSLDMGNVSQIVPSIHPFVAIAPKSAPLHSRPFARRAGGPAGRKGLEIASRALAATLLRAVHDPAILRAARRAFAAGGHPSGSPRSGGGAR